LQPLSEEQVDTHLVKMGKPLAALRAALRKNTGLGELATTPLMLQVLILTYNGTSVRELSHKEAQLREQIWNDYVQRMVSRKGDAKRYPLQTTITWLSFLAREMRKHDQTILSLEQLQPDWLPKGRRTFYQWSVRLVIGLLGGLSVGLSIGLLFGLLFGHIIGLFFGLLSGLSFGLSFALVFEPGMTTRLAETLTWSWKDLRARFVGWLLGGLIFGLSFGLLSGWLFEQGLGLSSPLGSTLGVGLSSALSIGLSVGLSFGLGIGLFFGFSRKQLTTSEMLSPNEGIRRSIKNGLLIWLSVGVFSGGPVVLIGDLLGRMPLGLSLGLSAGLFVGPGLGLIFGLGAVVQHYIMRFWLAQSGVFPWRAVPFLEDVTARILLRRVGGGYSFAHRLLLDYFADLDAQTPLAQGAAQTKATSCRLYVSFALSVHEFCATSTISGGNVWSRVGGCVTFQENALVRASRHLW